MSGPLQGFTAVEMGLWVAGPSAALMLHEWGAEVIKIESPRGDPMRGLNEGQGSAAFQLDNRGKRGVCLDLNTDEGLKIARSLIGRADVFVSNMRPEILEGWRLDYESLREEFPRLVYAQITGYGLHGEDRDRPAYDYGAYWSRSGLAHAVTPEGAPHPSVQRGGMGDHMTGLATIGGICAALLEREKTGRGRLVSTSLLRVGMYTLGIDFNTVKLMQERAAAQEAAGEPAPPPPPAQQQRTATRPSRTRPANVLFNLYADSEGKWFFLLGLEGDRHFPKLAAAVGHPEWARDERFSSIAGRAQHGEELVAHLDAIFATKTREEWGAILDAHDMWWAPMQTVLETLEDPQAEAAGAWVDVPLPEGGAFRQLATPVDFPSPSGDLRDEGTGPRAPTPELGQHTEEVLLELGYDWEQIVGLKDRGVIP